MATQLIKARVGSEDVWVEAVVMPGTQKTAGPASLHVIDAFDSAREVILEAAQKIVDATVELGRRSAAPDEVGVEFGLKFGSTGSVIIASGTAEASLKVTLTYRKASAEAGE